MIIQKQDKKKLYINLAVLLIVFGVAAYFLFPIIFPSSKGTNKAEDLGAVSTSPTFVKKYKTLKKIETNIFDDDRFKSLRPAASADYIVPDKGNLKPFSPK